MRFTRYSKFNGLDVYGINLGDLMESLSDSLLSSGYDDDYYWTREQIHRDTSLDALRRALLEALMEQRLLSQHQIQQMLDENDGKYEGSQLQEMLNQLIERLVEEGYLKLHEEPLTAQQRREMMGGNGEGRIEEPLPRNVKFEVTEKGLDFLGYKTLRNLLGSLGKSSIGRHDTPHLATGVEAEAASKPYEFGDTINLDVNTTLLSAIQREGLIGSAESRIQGSARASVRLPIVMRDGGDAGLLALDDSVRRRPVHAGKEGCAGARPFDSHAVSGRFAEDGSVPRHRRRTSHGKACEHASRSVSHEHRRRFAAGAAHSAGAAQGHEADRDGDGRKTDGMLYRGRSADIPVARTARGILPAQIEMRTGCPRSQHDVSTKTRWAAIRG